MSTEKFYPEGMRAFSPRQGGPDFVKGTLVITPNALFKWLKENPSLLTEYNGEKQLKLQILDGKKGLYLQVDTYKKAEENLPF